MHLLHILGSALYILTCMSITEGRDAKHCEASLAQSRSQWDVYVEHMNTVIRCVAVAVSVPTNNALLSQGANSALLEARGSVSIVFGRLIVPPSSNLSYHGGLANAILQLSDMIDEGHECDARDALQSTSNNLMKALDLLKIRSTTLLAMSSITGLTARQSLISLRAANWVVSSALRTVALAPIPTPQQENATTKLAELIQIPLKAAAEALAFCRWEASSAARLLEAAKLGYLPPDLIPPILSRPEGYWSEHYRRDLLDQREFLLQNAPEDASSLDSLNEQISKVTAWVDSDSAFMKHVHDNTTLQFNTINADGNCFHLAIDAIVHHDTGHIFGDVFLRSLVCSLLRGTNLLNEQEMHQCASRGLFVAYEPQLLGYAFYFKMNFLVIQKHGAVFTRQEYKYAVALPYFEGKQQCKAWRDREVIWCSSALLLNVDTEHFNVGIYLRRVPLASLPVFSYEVTLDVPPSSEAISAKRPRDWNKSRTKGRAQKQQANEQACLSLTSLCLSNWIAEARSLAAICGVDPIEAELALFKGGGSTAAAHRALAGQVMGRHQTPSCKYVALHHSIPESRSHDLSILRSKKAIAVREAEAELE